MKIINKNLSQKKAGSENSFQTVVIIVLVIIIMIIIFAIAQERVGTFRRILGL